MQLKAVEEQNTALLKAASENVVFKQADRESARAVHEAAVVSQAHRVR